MRPTEDTDLLTVAALREPREDGTVEILFNERQQVFTLPRAAKAREPVHRRLREALDRDMPVRATLNPRLGRVEKTAEPSGREAEAFQEARALLEDPDRIHRVDVESIDPTTFNIVDHYLKARTFALCKKTIPSYKVAREIFDFCAAQSCHLPGPPVISQCIPFQYVIDGCYARAHKMRQVIEEKYGYCSEKVFSFANEGGDTLAVKANMWGGCCVYWWYHVAPLVRVRIKINLLSSSFQFVLAMVIDPSMFAKPVLLSTWLAAQASKTCAEHAKVSMYSIQPSGAYTPANYQGTAFSTDPDYSKTHGTLASYKNLTTC
jgi:hypothetical protein